MLFLFNYVSINKKKSIARTSHSVACVSVLKRPSVNLLIDPGWKGLIKPDKKGAET